jgi:nitroreductase
MVSIYQVICERRTIRRFKNKPVPKEILLKLVNAGRLAPSGANIQPCEFILITDTELTEQIFPLLKWAAYISPEGDPPRNERPVAYIVVLIDLTRKNTKGEVDAAAAIQNILLAAWSDGIGTCWLGSIDRKGIQHLLCIPDNLAVNSVVALGFPNEMPILEEGQESIRYWKDEQGRLHVPKRKLADILHINRYGEKMSALTAGNQD